jgi:hypothetical protein
VPRLSILALPLLAESGLRLTNSVRDRVSKGEAFKNSLFTDDSEQIE